MRPTAPTAFSQPQPRHAALHCGELISMKDCGLWATMTCKPSKNFFLALFLHLYAWGAVQKVQSLVRWNAAQVISDSGELRAESKMWVLQWPTPKERARACVRVSFRYTWRLARWNIRLTVIIPSIIVGLLALRSLFPPPGLISTQCGLQQSPAVRCSRVLTNQTSQCHWAASSKTHGCVSSPHPLAFQCLAGSQAKNLQLKQSRGLG